MTPRRFAAYYLREKWMGLPMPDADCEPVALYCERYMCGDSLEERIASFMKAIEGDYRQAVQDAVQAAEERRVTDLRQFVARQLCDKLFATVME